MSSLPGLRILLLRNNKIASLDSLQKLLLDCYKIVCLDLRNNELDADLRDILMVIKEQCPGLRKLFIENSTKNNETKTPSVYAEFVFRMLPNLESVEDIGHPLKPTHKITTMIELEQQCREEAKKNDERKAPNSSNNSTPVPSAPKPNDDDGPTNLESYMPENEVDSVQSILASAMMDIPALSSPTTQPQLLSDSNKTAYPDINISPEEYLPKDYHMTIGRKYDLRAIMNQAKEETQQLPNEEQYKDEDEDEPPPYSP